MSRCFSNNRNRGDFLREEMEKFGENTDVFIAVAFFTDSNFIKKLVKKGCTVRLVVRLGFPTSDQRLREVLNMQDVHVRYFTGNNFHPKLYIFGDDAAFVGSSNLTDAGLVSNAELNMLIEPEDPEFDRLKEIFREYWEEAGVLKEDVLHNYSHAVSHMFRANSEMEKEISKTIGDVIFPNIRRDVKRKSKPKEFEDIYLKKYQVFLSAFETLRRIYRSMDKRKVDEDKLPLRIEIDQFLSWVREHKARGESFLVAPVRKGEDLESFLKGTIEEFITSEHPYMNHVVQQTYPKIVRNFRSKENIDSLTSDEVFETLLVVHAFIEQQRFFTGGLQGLKEKFLHENDISQIKTTIKHLLFGEGHYTKRMADCIFNPEYKLGHFSKSCVQETYGWMNTTETPICNERTLRSMQWLGFGKL